MSPLHLLISELERATTPFLGRSVGGVKGGRQVLGWPEVSHPAIVREWLGDLAVVDSWHAAYEDEEVQEGEDTTSVAIHGWPHSEVGTLSDPEAAGWALSMARCLLRGCGEGTYLAHIEMAPDEPCRQYVRRIWGHSDDA